MQPGCACRGVSRLHRMLGVNTRSRTSIKLAGSKGLSNMGFKSSSSSDMALIPSGPLDEELFFCLVVNRKQVLAQVHKGGWRRMQKRKSKARVNRDALEGRDGIVCLHYNVSSAFEFYRHGFERLDRGILGFVWVFLWRAFQFVEGTPDDRSRKVTGFKNHRLGTQMQTTLDFCQMSTGIEIFVERGFLLLLPARGRRWKRTIR
mmetsp:Transcript_10340/g.30254  ORF Transcript_10340/g.30254 Transcript_10340/m.30254 type:complete len:204 (-) Transcript_10340:537-1148(-)